MAKKRKPLKLKELNITLPTAWGELSPEQLMRVAYHIATKRDDVESLIQLATELADLHPRGARMTPDGELKHLYYHRDVGIFALAAEDLAAMVKALEWVSAEPAPMVAPPLDGLTTPDRRMFGITLEQYITAESACSEFARSQNPAALRMMVAALYPRSDSYSPELLTAEAQRISYLPAWHLEAVLLWFIGAKKFLMSKYPFVFTPGQGDAQASASGVDTLLGVLSAVNDGRVVDNEKLKQTEIHEIFYELNTKIANSQKSKK